MYEKLKEKYKQLSDEELTIIAYKENDKYEDHAIEAAKVELYNRGIEVAENKTNINNKEKSNKKTERFLCVKIISWYLIISGIAGLLASLKWKILLKMYNNNYYSYFILIYDLVASPIEIIAGVFMIRLKNWARKLAIILTLFGIIQAIVLPFSINRQFYNDIKVIFFHLIYIVTISMLIILYLNSQKVREKFKIHTGKYSAGVKQVKRNKKVYVTAILNIVVGSLSTLLLGEGGIFAFIIGILYIIYGVALLRSKLYLKLLIFAIFPMAVLYTVAVITSCIGNNSLDYYKMLIVMQFIFLVPSYLCLWDLYFFTRSDVKEDFKEKYNKSENVSEGGC